MTAKLTGKNKRYNHEVAQNALFNNQKSGCIDTLETIDDEPEHDMSSANDVAEGEEVTQYGANKNGIRATFLVPAVGEERDPVLVILDEARQDREKRVSVKITDPPECALDIPNCVVKRLPFTTGKNEPLKVQYELKRSGSSKVTPPEPPGGG